VARIRTIKPCFFLDERLSALSAETQLLAAGLLCYADDEGYFNANPKLVGAAIFATRELPVSVHDMLTELCNVGYIELGSCADGRTYGRIVNFLTHQRINRPTQSVISSLQVSWNTHTQVSESSTNVSSGIRNKEGNKEKEKTGASAFVCPSWISADVWQAFEEMRKKSRKPLTDFARRGIIGKLEKWKAGGHNPDAILGTSIENSWGGVFEPKSFFAEKKPIANDPPNAMDKFRANVERLKETN
jgi:hypothetical protein